MHPRVVAAARDRDRDAAVGPDLDRRANCAGRFPQDLDRLASAKVGALRLSPHTGDFVGVTKAFTEVASGGISGEEGLARLRSLSP